MQCFILEFYVAITNFFFTFITLGIYATILYIIGGTVHIISTLKISLGKLLARTFKYFSSYLGRGYQVLAPPLITAHEAKLTIWQFVLNKVFRVLPRRALDVYFVDPLRHSTI